MLKCVMYFSEYILKYIISKVKKKKCLSPSPWIFLSHRCLEVLGTKVTGMVRAEHGGARQKVKDPANTGGGGGGVHVTPASRLLLWSCWWELALEKCLRLLSPLSLTPSQQRRGTLSETDRSSGQVLSSSIYPWNSGCRSSTPTLALGLSEQGGRVLSVHSSFMEEEEQACFCFRSKPHPPTQH